MKKPIKPKAGDRVRITSLESYSEEAKQGLFVGNTGTVLRLEGNCAFIQTDGPTQAALSKSMSLDGWLFWPESLEVISGIHKPINWQRVAQRMAAAKTIKEARVIYNKAIKRGKHGR